MRLRLEALGAPGVSGD